MATLTGLKERFSSPARRHLADRFLASDPGLGRLRNALRVTLSAGASALVCLPLVAAGSTIAPLFGGLVSLLAAMMVGDEEPHQRKLTTLLLFAPAALSVTLGALLVSMRWLEALTILAAVFLALYLRRFGPRYVAVGMMTLFPLFISSFVRFEVEQLPGLIFAAAVGTLSAYAFRFFLIPDRPHSVLRMSLASFVAQLGLTLDAVITTLEDRHADEARRKLLRREADRLNERATTAEGNLSAQDADVSRERSDRLRLYLFDAEMSANTLSETAWRYATSECDFPPEVRNSLLRTLRKLRTELPDEGVPTGSEKLRLALEDLENARQRASSSEDASDWSFQALRAEAALRQLSGGAGEEQGPATAESEEESGEDDEEENDDQREGGVIERLRPATIQGIQATLASGLALLAGLAISPDRPYWVVITAFVVFMGSGTVGDTLSRGFQRTLGTFGGAFVGFFLASTVSGNIYVEAPLIAVCVFLAFYFFPISQGLLMFWITVVLALAFDLIGRLEGGGILAVRSLDTLVGSAIGVAVSMLILPTKTTDKIRECTAGFLDALKDYLRDRIDRLAGGDPSRHPIEEAREVESKLREVTQNAATARRQATVFGSSRSDLERRITALTALNYYARHLADPKNRGQHLEDDEDRRRRGELLREAKERISANLDSLCGAVSDGKRPEIQDIEDLMEKIEAASGEHPPRKAGEDNASANPGEPSDALYYLRRINRALGELAAVPDIQSRRKKSGPS